MGRMLSLILSSVLFFGSSCAANAQKRISPVPRVVADGAPCGPAPQDVTIASQGTYVHITWTPVPGARRYQLGGQAWTGI